jgi:hypothetical protein
MFDCKNLLHPFQNDPGTSQRQRIIDALLDDSAQIDGRTLADITFPICPPASTTTTTTCA